MNNQQEEAAAERRIREQRADANRAEWRNPAGKGLLWNLGSGMVNGFSNAYR